jgi:DNA-directed RNA polymerase beta' subunit
MRNQAPQLFSEVSLKLASPDRILEWSFGEVTKARNYQLPHATS